ncbi:hypothetical protein PIB30_112864, partial [Stylosanthes scabra]|nr:hypothetical protein [Stylosanthes scabra]
LVTTISMVEPLEVRFDYPSEMNMDMLVTIVRVPLLVMPWIGYEFLGLRTRNNHIYGRTFGSTVRLPQWYQSLNYIEQREGIIGMIGSKRNSSGRDATKTCFNGGLVLPPKE